MDLKNFFRKNFIKRDQMIPFVVFIDDLNCDKNCNKNCNNLSYRNEYDMNIDIICNIIKSSILEKFGEVIYNIWFDHMYNGKTYKELTTIYGDHNFMRIFRNIKKFLIEKLPKINKIYKELIEDYLN